MRYPKEHVENYRRSAGDLENDLIDELKSGGVDRREFLVRGSVLGMGATLTTLIAFGPEAAFAKTTPAATRRRTGGTIRVGGAPADGSLEPPLLQSLGALAVSHMAGEQLVYTDVHAKVQPQLATSWKPSNKAKTWTFKLRSDVKFHDGTPMTADDVVSTFERLTGPNSQALSSLGGVLSPGGTTKVDDTTVKFSLDAANGFFPYLLGQMTYQCIVLPKSYQLPSDLSKPGDWTTKMNGTGPFRLKENRGQAGYSFIANDSYWGGKPGIDDVEFTVLEDNARVAALRGGQIDIAVQIDYAGARQLQSAQVLPIGTSNHRYLNMNVKKAPFKDVRVREAIALALGRPAIASGLWGKYAQVGNDSPMWSGYPFTDKSLPQRKQDIAKAKSLLKAAGATNLKLTLTCYRAFEMPAYAQRVASDLKKIGIDCKVKIFTSAQYFDGVSFGAKGKLAPWLSTDFGIVDYGARPVPLTYLNAALKSGGVWNAARYGNKAFDKSIANFTAATEVGAQKKYAKAMESQLLRDTPAIYAYFYNFIAGASTKVKGYVPDGGGVVDLRKTTIG